MRYALLALGIAVCIGIGQGWFSTAYDAMTTAALTEDARIALDISCEGKAGAEAQTCRSRLTRLYLSGSLDPDKTLRTWCDTQKSAHWGGSRPAPPELCVQRYGGWREG